MLDRVRLVTPNDIRVNELIEDHCFLNECRRLNSRFRSEGFQCLGAQQAVADTVHNPKSAATNLALDHVCIANDVARPKLDPKVGYRHQEEPATYQPCLGLAAKTIASRKRVSGHLCLG